MRIDEIAFSPSRALGSTFDSLSSMAARAFTQDANIPEQTKQNFVKGFVQSASTSLQAAIGGRLVNPNNTTSIAKYLRGWVAKYMGDESYNQAAVEKEILNVARSYKQDKGRNALGIMALSIFALASQSQPASQKKKAIAGKQYATTSATNPDDQSTATHPQMNTQQIIDYLKANPGEIAIVLNSLKTKANS